MTLGVDNILFWSARPGKFVNKFTGEDVLKNIKFKGTLYTGSQEQWNRMFINCISDLFSDTDLDLENYNIEILCPEFISNMIPQDLYIKDDYVKINNLNCNIKIIGINEPRVDVFLNGKFAGAVNILDL